MTKARPWIAALAVSTAMMAGNACAQSCPEWLTVACPGEAFSVAAEDGVQQPNAQPKQTQAPPSARPAQAARPAKIDPEKEALFRQFLAWRQERLNTAANR